jgi:hypothetical protein
MGLRPRFRTVTLSVAIACLAVTALIVSATGAGAASKANDLKTARAGVLVASDLPSGWTGTRNPASSDAAAIKAAKKIPSCSDYVKLRTSTAPLPQARSLAFADGAGTTASNVVDAFAGTAKATTAMKLWSSTKMPACLEKFTQQAVGNAATVTVDTADVTALSPDAVGYSAKVSDSNGVVQEVLLSIAVPVGRFISVYTIDVQSADAVLDPVDAAVESSLTRLDTAVNS